MCSTCYLLSYSSLDFAFGKTTSGRKGKIEQSNETRSGGDREDRNRCSDEILGDGVSTIFEEPLLVLTHTTRRIDK